MLINCAACLASASSDLSACPRCGHVFGDPLEGNTVGLAIKALENHLQGEPPTRIRLTTITLLFAVVLLAAVVFVPPLL
jgi:hypothetical protein